MPVITFMQSIYNYITETNHVSTVYTVAAVLYLQSVLHVMLFTVCATCNVISPVKYVLYLYISTFCSSVQCTIWLFFF